MARDDWRIRIELPEEEHAHGLLGRLGSIGGDPARRLEHELEGRRLAVTRDDATVFVYTASALEAERALEAVQAELADEGLHARVTRIEHWLGDEERWDDEPPSETWEEEAIEHGYAPWEVRVECESLADASELADRLRAEGYGVSHTFTFVIAGTATREQAVELARRVHGEVEPGGELVYEVQPSNPFAVFGGLGT
jgi:hypothetical protein